MLIFFLDLCLGHDDQRANERRTLRTFSAAGTRRRPWTQPRRRWPLSPFAFQQRLLAKFGRFSRLELSRLFEAESRGLVLPVRHRRWRQHGLGPIGPSRQQQWNRLKCMHPVVKYKLFQGPVCVLLLFSKSRFFQLHFEWHSLNCKTNECSSLNSDLHTLFKKGPKVGLLRKRLFLQYFTLIESNKMC